MTSFANLKRNRSSLEKLTKAIETSTNQSENSNSSEDNRFWKPEVDKAGNGMAVIRFLPAPAVDGDDALPWVRYFDHGFQGPGGWYIENSLTTLGQKDPVSEYNSTLWNSGIEANKDIARKQKRRLHYIANIFVVSDPSHPENEGQIRLYKFGKKIFDKITEAMNPEFADETPVNPFDLWDGANFKLKIRNVEGYRNYDKSEFDESSKIFDDESQIEELWNSYANSDGHKLQSFIDPSKFKSYDELKAKLHRVLALDSGNHPSVNKDPVESAPPPVEKKAEPKKQAAAVTTDGDDDAMDFFKKLAEED